MFVMVRGFTTTHLEFHGRWDFKYKPPRLVITPEPKGRRMKGDQMIIVLRRTMACFVTGGRHHMLTTLDGMRDSWDPVI